MENDSFYDIAITSYNRAFEQLTLEYLKKIRTPAEKITIYVQTPEDYRDYKEKYVVPDYPINIVYAPATCHGGSLKNVLNHMRDGQCVVALDDDIKSIDVLVKGVRTQKGELTPINSFEILDRFIRHAFIQCIKKKTKLWGVYPVNNAFFMKNGTSELALLDATMIGIIKSDINFNEKYTLKEDYAFCAEHIRKYKKIIRFDYVSCNAKHKSKGGCEEFWKTDNPKMTAMLLKEYPDILKAHKNRAHEVELIRKSKDKSDKGRKKVGVM